MVATGLCSRLLGLQCRCCESFEDVEVEEERSDGTVSDLYLKKRILWIWLTSYL